MHRRFLTRIHYSIFMLLFVSFAGNADHQVVGKAHDLESGQHLYSEYHSCTGDHRECLVNYRDSSGQLIASKKLTYSAGPTQPALVMKDYRTGIDTSIASQYREGLVVDAGFDNFVRGQWDVFATGDTVNFLFLGTGFDEPLKMRARLGRPGSCADEQLCLEISPNSWTLGLFVDPINLVYSRQNRRLLRYQGISNIRGENTESLVVDIHYHYEELEPPTGSPTQQKNPSFRF